MSRYADAVKHAITVANDEALRLGRNCVTPDLILLGVIDADRDGLAAQAMRSAGLDLDELLHQHIAGPDNVDVPAPEPGAHLPLCAETRRAMELAEQKRLKLGRDQIDTAAVLLALIESGAETSLTRLLAPYGVHPGLVRQRIYRLAFNTDDPSVASPLDDEITLRLSRRQIMTITAALARYIDYWEQHAAAAGYESHPVEQLDDVQQRIGELIWDMEVAAAPRGARLEHSQRARRPSPRE
jgi:ATP-dependent Clp protease ATP-binding subunit ClpA